MKSCDQLIDEMAAIQQQMLEAKKNESQNLLKEFKRLWKEFGFSTSILNGSLVEGCNKK